jgi:hypothetical protein
MLDFILEPDVNLDTLGRRFLVQGQSFREVASTVGDPAALGPGTLPLG